MSQVVVFVTAGPFTTLSLQHCGTSKALAPAIASFFKLLFGV